MLAEGLRVLVVGDEHELKHMVDAVLNSKVVNDILATTGFTPQVITMTMDEWTLRNVDDYLLYLSVTSGNMVPAQENLYRDAYHPIHRPNSKYLFKAYDVYEALGESGNEASVRTLTARQIIPNYLSDAENPLVAAVLSEQALAWCDARTVWLDQLPSQTTIWCLHDDSDKLRLVRFGAVAHETDSPSDIG